MDMEFLKMFSVDGVWALLSVALIFYILKSQEKRDERQDQREQNYQQMILSLTETAKDITDVKQLLQDHLAPSMKKVPNDPPAESINSLFRVRSRVSSQPVGKRTAPHGPRQIKEKENALCVTRTNTVRRPGSSPPRRG